MQIDPAAVRIITFPDPRLRRVCKPVDTFDEGIARLATRMLDLMHESQGIGLAAPQVGILLRLFVCNVTGEPEDDKVYVNPTLSDFEGNAPGDEGCLSIPDVTVAVRRPVSCRMQACDVKGKPFETEGTEFLARVWQHENGHLDGHLILDYMSEADKIANRRALRQLEAQYRPGKAAS